MPINYDALPSNKSFSVLSTGRYLARILEATMKQGKDPSKPMYLNLKLECYDENTNEKQGTLFDIITESEAEIPKYKLRKFIEALKLPITGTFELKDLTKMVVGKELYVDVVQKEDDRGSMRASVDSLKGEIFYPVEEVPFEFNAEDAADATGNTGSEDTGDLF